tara:strand:- start:201 stop:986 length:786 start_codon:yes stop_codon:yes gene_type:complete
MKKIKHIILIGSGKGGVGKSTVAVNLSVTLAKQNNKVGLLDADIYGPSIPKMMGVNEKPKLNSNKKLEPFFKYGIKFMSIGSMIPSEKPIIWRAPMVVNALNQLLRDITWEELDYLIIDLPPGTGDIQLTLSQNLEITGVIIVSTPQEVALEDVRRAINMFRQVKVEIIGIIQNMSYFEDSKENKIYLLGKNNVFKESKKQNLNFLGEIPIVQDISSTSDKGRPISVNESSKVSIKFQEIVNRVRQIIGKQNIQETNIEIN